MCLTDAAGAGQHDVLPIVDVLPLGQFEHEGLGCRRLLAKVELVERLGLRKAGCLDFDDGVKVNYAKFGTLLADGKKVSGTKGDG